MRTGQEEKLVENLLQVENLNIRFKVRNGYLYAVNGVSFHLQQGELLGVVGESGCGKSITMMSLIKLLPPAAEVTSGRILLEGKDILNTSLQELNTIRGSKTGFIFQDPMTSLNPYLKIGTQLCERLIYHNKMKKNEAEAKAIQYLKLVGISNSEHRMKEYPHQLSGGMRQRIMIAMALLSDPPLVIADEPTTALDVTIQAQIVELIKELRGKINLSLIWVTHDLSLLAGIADRVMVMYAGLVVESAPVLDLYKTPSHPYTIGLLKSIPKIDAPTGIKLSSIGGAPPNLFSKPESCPFFPRCPYRMKKCETDLPPLLPVNPHNEHHLKACWAEGVQP